MTEIDIKTKAHAFLTSNTLGTLATVASDGSPRARSLYYATDDTFAVYFVTLSNTRKADDLAHNSAASFVVSNENIPATLQIEGTVENITDTAVLNETVHNILATLMKKGEHFAPVTRMDAARVEFYKLTPTWVRFGNFVIGEGNSEVFGDVLP
jgi:general stress protein 26